MPEEASQFKRIHAADVSIAEIRPDNIRVRVLGTVIDKNDTRIVIDDGTGKLEVVFDNNVDVKINQLVRVFGRIIPLENGFELQGEIIQDMSGLDMDLYKKVKGLVKR